MQGASFGRFLLGTLFWVPLLGASFGRPILGALLA